MNELLKNSNISEIAEKGTKIYEKIKGEHSKNEGNFLAIDVDSERVFPGKTSSEAVEKARKAIPDKVFYVVKIGYSAAEVLASLGR